MSIFNRPIQNIKSIDFGALAWVLFWMIGLFVVVIPVQIFSDIGNVFSLLFSFNFIEKIEVHTDPTLPSMFQDTSRVELLNKLYIFFNVAKVIFWSLTLGLIIRFLFKEPKSTKELLCTAKERR